MGFSIYQGDTPTIFRSVLQDTASTNIALSMDINMPLGDQTFECQIIDEFDDEGERFKPQFGQRIRWVADDGTGTVLFDGFLYDPNNEQAGFNDVGAEILNYTLNAKDPSWLWEKKVIEAGTFKNFKPGTLIYTLANACDSRFLQATDNDEGHDVGDLELGKITYREAIEQIAKTACLIVWVDQNWRVHCKKWSTIIGLSQDEKFNITDSNKIYSNLNLAIDGNKVCNRVKVIGSTMDSGTINPQNRKQGKQKRENQPVTRTASLADINVMRNRIGYEDIAVGTDPTTLPSTTEGIFEDKLDCQDVYDKTTLEVIGDAYLAMYSLPLLKGSVEFTDSGLVPGKSILVNSETRTENALLPVVELNIESSGFDTSGNKTYKYTAHLNGPSSITEFARSLEPPKEVAVKAEMLIKPAPPTITGHTSTEVNSGLGQWELSGEIRCNYEE